MRSFLIIAVVALIIADARTAHAHAMLDHASPPVGSVVPNAPRELTLRFTEDIEPAFSQVEIRGANGDVVSAGKAQIDRSNRAQLRVPLKRLTPGTYTVTWNVLSVDTHRTQGHFTFRVGP